MRMRLIMAVTAAVLGLGFGLSQPAVAGGGERGCCGNAYIHHHVYYPPRFVHVYHHYRPTLRRHTAVHYNYVCCGSGTRYGHWRGYRRWW
jgi:hypothetical protein